MSGTNGSNPTRQRQYLLPSQTLEGIVHRTQAGTNTKEGNVRKMYVVDITLATGTRHTAQGAQSAEARVSIEVHQAESPSTFEELNKAIPGAKISVPCGVDTLTADTRRKGEEYARPRSGMFFRALEGAKILALPKA